MPQVSHRHHYVPEWYQRRFLAPGQTAFQILDLKPEEFRDKKGNLLGKARAVFERGPASWFYEKDLYTTRWFGQANDDIEKFLFGRIDKKGQKAFDALIADDWKQLHEYYDRFFEFMDAMRLRSPKGLLFLRALLKPQNQYELMMSMQTVRTMHCVMWGEGGREILIVPEGATTHLIFSDHPVTFYNRHVFPADPSMPSFVDPLQQWQGTQTVFPLDRRKLAVFTHNEWGRDPIKKNARVNRTNARMFDNPLIRFDDWHRKRTLTEDQVLAVNYIIKARAFRYIAAPTVEDLYPEKRLKNRMWDKVGAFLMPPSMAVNRQVGYTVVGMADGSYYFQDQHGQRPQTKEEYDRAVEQAKREKAHIDKVLRAHFEKKAKEEAERDAHPPKDEPQA